MAPRRSLALAVALALAGCMANPETKPAQAPAEGLMRWPDLLERERPKPTTTIRYGEDQMQVVDLWLPQGRGPHPTVLMVHGGCWQTEIADRRIMNWIAEDLRGRGIAVWNIDYRGVDRTGGGYPGTFADAAAAADALRDHAPQHRLDIDPLVAIGHSAGGHLALWLAARRNIARDSRLHAADPIRIDTAISLGGLQDLELAATPPGSGCGTEVVEKLVGPPTLSSRNVYADTSVPRLLPLRVRQVLINGVQDRIIPAHFASDYAAKAKAAGERVKVRMIDRTGHVELIAPESAAWKAAVEEIRAALRRR